MDKHTPVLQLPLELAEARTTIPIKDATGKTIATVRYGENDLDYAKFIQRACNTHAELLDWLKAAEGMLTQCMKQTHFTLGACSTMQKIREAIAKAEGK